MEGKSFGEYRLFSKAAQEIGMADRDERKLSGMDPGLLLDDASEEVRERVAPEMLVTFLKTLQGEKDVDPRNVLEIGNALYRYRADKGHPAVEYNDKEERLIALACRLVENAFYSGKVIDLKDEHSASLAFVTNITAKLLSQRKDQPLAWYDVEKFHRFCDEVESFKNEQLSEMFAFGDPTMTAQIKIQEYEKEMRREMEKLNDIVGNTDWNVAISDLKKRIDEALETLCDSDVFQKKYFQINDFRLSFDQRIGNTDKIVNYLRNEVGTFKKKLDGKDLSYQIYGDNFSHLLYAVQLEGASIPDFQFHSKLEW